MADDEYEVVSQPQPAAPQQGHPLDAGTYMPGLFQTESGNDPAAVGDDGAAVGLGQLHRAAAIDAGIAPAQRTDPAANASASQKYLQQQLDKYQDPYTGLLAYNWGPGNVDKWLANGANLADIPPDHAAYPTKVSGGAIAAPQDQWEVESSAAQQPAGASPDTAPQNDYSIKGDLSQMGQSVKSGVQDIKDLFNSDTWTGKNIASGTTPASQKLQIDAVKGNWSNVPRDVLDRMNEAFAGNPAGKAMGAMGGIAGAPLAPAINAETEGLEAASIPKDVTQGVMNVSPLFMRGMDADRGAPAVNDPLARRMEDLGVKLNKTALNGGAFSKTLASTVKEIPGSGADAAAEETQQSLNQAVAKTIGQPDATKIDSGVFNKAQTDTGLKYDSIVKGQTMQMQPDHLQRLAQIQMDANKYLKGDNSSYVNNLVNNLFDDVSPNGTISGEKLSDWRNQLGNSLKGQPDGTTKYIADLRDTVMDMTTVKDPAKQALLQQANQEWRNQKAIEPIVAKAQADGGNISPALLRGAVGTKYNLAKGEGGDLGTLANGAYKYIREPLANSGTGRNLMTKAAVMEPIAATMWALGSGDITPLLSSLGGIGAAVAGARGFNKWNYSKAGVDRLLNGRPNSYSAIRLHPANMAGISANQQNRVNGQ